jgi:hypothetical protein
MSEEPQLSHVFAGMLGELEDAETKLVTRQAELARELADVEGELAKLAAVREAMMGKPVRKKAASAGAKDKAAAIAAWATDKGTFTAGQAADALEIKRQGIGPVLAGMIRRGEATVDDSNGERVYSLAGT